MNFWNGVQRKLSKKPRDYKGLEQKEICQYYQKYKKILHNLYEKYIIIAG